jgi:hypothetical protein
VDKRGEEIELMRTTKGYRCGFRRVEAVDFVAGVRRWG